MWDTVSKSAPFVQVRSLSKWAKGDLNPMGKLTELRLPAPEAFIGDHSQSVATSGDTVGCGPRPHTKGGNMTTAWSRLLHLVGVHCMQASLDDGDTLITKCWWCEVTTVGISPGYGKMGP
jgi:hypothetical protein